MKNEEKAKEIANEMVELAHYSSVMTPDEQRNNIMNVADVACMEMAKWKDEQHQQSLIDLNCKLEEQQANYEELKKRYDEAVERVRIVVKILVDIAKDHNVDDKTIQDFLNDIGIKKHKK